MAALTIAPHAEVVADEVADAAPPLAVVETVAVDAHPEEGFWPRFGRMFIFTGLFFAIFLFVGCFLITISAGGSVIGGVAIGAMAALWGTPCFGALFAANLASEH